MKVVLISGKAQSGKDTTAAIMKGYLESVYNRRVLITHYADLLKYICKAFFGWDGNKDERGRSLLQHVGTDVIRKHDPSFLSKFLIRIGTMFDDYWDYVIIPDVRFPNEISDWRLFGFKVLHVRIERPEFDNGLTDEQKMHQTETALDDTNHAIPSVDGFGLESTTYGMNLVTKPDFYLQNDGTLDELKNKVIKFTKENILVWHTKLKTDTLR